MRKYRGPIEVSEVVVGKRVKIICARITEIFRTDNDYIEGVVVDIFDGGRPYGYQLDVANSSQWWRWMPLVDGGVIFVEE